MADDDAVAAYLARERAALGKLTNSYFAYTGCIPGIELITMQYETISLGMQERTPTSSPDRATTRRTTRLSMELRMEVEWTGSRISVSISYLVVLLSPSSY
jgi:hypothetical protein